LDWGPSNRWRPSAGQATTPTLIVEGAGAPVTRETDALALFRVRTDVADAYVIGVGACVAFTSVSDLGAAAFSLAIVRIRFTVDIADRAIEVVTGAGEGTCDGLDASTATPLDGEIFHVGRTVEVDAFTDLVFQADVMEIVTGGTGRFFANPAVGNFDTRTVRSTIVFVVFAVHAANRISESRASAGFNRNAAAATFGREESLSVVGAGEIDDHALVRIF
jgi:hypothetical protein